MTDPGAPRAENSEQTEKNNESSQSTQNSNEALVQKNTSEELDPKALEELEESLKSEDPEFAESIKEIGKDKSISGAAIEALEISVIEVQEETKGFWGKIKYRLVNMGHVLMDLALDFIRSLPARLRQVKTKVSAFFEAINEALRQFSYYPRARKIQIYGFVFLVIGTCVYLAFAVRGKLLTPKDRFFMTSLDEWAEKKIDIDPNGPREAFYDSLRVYQNLLLMNKVVVNLQPSARSGPNPMVAVELLFEGNGPEVLVEIKDRESEFRDLLQREIEAMNFDQLDTSAGKQMMTEKIKRGINRYLTQGKIKKVFLKNLVLKN